MIRGLRIVCAVALSGIASGPAFATDEPELAVAERGPFVAKIEVDGVFHEREPVVLAHRPEAAIGDVRIVEAVAPGPVAKGQVLARLEAPDLDWRIRQAELDLDLARIRLARQREEVRRIEETKRLELRRAELKLADAEHALDLFRTVEAPRRLRGSELTVELWDVQWAEAEEEHQVLVRMYEADGVIETRERMDMEARRRNLDRALQRKPSVAARHEILGEVTLPGELAALEFAVRKARHARDLAARTIAPEIERSRDALVKSELALRRQERALETLRLSLDMLTITAPVHGFAFAGHYHGGWKTLDPGHRVLRPGTPVSSGQVLFTIVQAAPKLVRATVPEARLLEVREEQEATLIPTAAGDVSLPARVTHVERPCSDGSFTVWLDARTRHERLFPGSTCRVRMIVAEKADALTVPASAVRREGGEAFVDVWSDGETIARRVEVGATSGGRTEILAGLEAGERVQVAGN